MLILDPLEDLIFNFKSSAVILLFWLACIEVFDTLIEFYGFLASFNYRFTALLIEMFEVENKVVFDFSIDIARLIKIIFT